MWRNTQSHLFSKRIRLIVASAAILFFLLSAELGARYYIAFGEWNIRRYRLSKPVQYAHSPYWSIDFVNEYDGLNQVMTDYGYFIFDDFHGLYYNIENGARRTVGTPIFYSHTVWLFGNSSTFDPYVPDDYTMASQLQELLNRSAYRWRVVNLAVNGAAISAETARMQHTAIKPGDIVVFIDGMADRPLNCPLNIVRIGLAYLVCEALDNLPALNPQPVVDRYNKIAHQAELYAHNQGAAFYHLVQPITGDRLSALGRSFVYVPPINFFDGTHLDDDGDSIVARALFERLTTL